MENTIYRIELFGKENSKNLEFYVCNTNEIEPYRKIKEIGLIFIGDEFDFNGSLDEQELESLITYLEDCKRHIKKFNENSKPKDE